MPAFLKKIVRRILDKGVKFLNDPVKAYEPHERTNLVKLKARLKLCDVVLVSGSARVSFIVRLLTTSPWSHVVLYVGDRSSLLTESDKSFWIEKYGKQCLQHLLIDADMLFGVHLRPLDDYNGQMLRQLRPLALRNEDRANVINYALKELGKKYDILHIIRLLFFFAFPWELLPANIRGYFTDWTMSETDQICSRILAEAFHSVGYPIRPISVIEKSKLRSVVPLAQGFNIRARGKSVMKLLSGGRFSAAARRFSPPRYARIALSNPRHIVPADYDLSRFFDIIKDPSDLNIDYRGIVSREIRR